jgi:hypothetical protein
VEVLEDQRLYLVPTLRLPLHLLLELPLGKQRGSRGQRGSQRKASNQIHEKGPTCLIMHVKYG